MGAFNRVKTWQTCPVCGQQADFWVQFKYGELWQHDYQIGDQIVWGGTSLDEGSPGHKRVVVEGTAENCPKCGADGQEFGVWLENDRIASVQPSSGKYNFAAAQDYHIVVAD